MFLSLIKQAPIKHASLKQVLFACLLIVFSCHLAAEKKKVFDGPDGSEYEVHYIAFNSTFLEPEVAKQYQLVRSKAVGMLNISVIKKESDGKTAAVGAVVEGQVINDIRQQWAIPFQQVVEESSIYYLSQVQFREGEILTFDLTIYPEGRLEPLKLRFSNSFYND